MSQWFLEANNYNTHPFGARNAETLHAKEPYGVGCIYFKDLHDTPLSHSLDKSELVMPDAAERYAHRSKAPASGQKRFVLQSVFSNQEGAVWNQIHDMFCMWLFSW